MAEVAEARGGHLSAAEGELKQGTDDEAELYARTAEPYAPFTQKLASAVKVCGEARCLGGQMWGEIMCVHTPLPFFFSKAGLFLTLVLMVCSTLESLRSPWRHWFSRSAQDKQPGHS